MKVLDEPIQVRQQRFVTDDGWSYPRAHDQSLGGQLYATANRQAKRTRTTLPPMAMGKRRRHAKQAVDVGGANGLPKTTAHGYDETITQTSNGTRRPCEWI